MKRIHIMTIFMLLALLLVACGGADPTPTPAPEPTEAVSAEPTEEEMAEEEMASETIVDIAVADGRFTTLVAAVQAAGLAETLSGEGPFTVFAPTDDAFAALPEGTVETLLEDPSGDLTDILLYHVVDGAVPASDVVTLNSATTLSGDDVTIEVVDGSVVLNDAVNVVITDIEASNGIIHVIDAVLLPPSDEAMDEETMEDMGSIVDIAVADGRFTTLVAAVEAAGLAETLSGEGEYTVFAPTDEAFAALPEGTVESLLEDPSGALTDILLYHVVQGAVPASDVVNLDSATTLFGEDITIEVVDGNVVLNGTVNVIITDIEASNGIIHVIDAVLLPPGDLPSIAEIAVEDGRFTTLVAALDAAGLVETLSNEGEFTVFAPTDDAFAALPEGTVESLLEDPSGALTDILLYHVVEGTVLAEDVVQLESATTLQGQEITISVTDDGVILNDSVMVIITDIEASNGVVHVIDGVLLPPELPSIAEIAVEDGRFTTLVAALEAAGLVETLSGEGEFTVFAPTDDAFAALPEGTLDALLADPQGDLTNILLYHVIEGIYMAGDVVELESATTLLGEDITITVTEDGVILNDTVMIIITDIQASNGVIHVINAVLIPPSAS